MSICCKNCGGQLRALIESNRIVCDSCGASQPLTGAADSQSAICSGRDAATLLAYQRAVHKMNTAQSEEEFRLAATMFGRLGDTLDAALLETQCSARAVEMHDEAQYQQALAAMNSDDPARIRQAKASLEAMPHYKDALSKAAQCQPLLEAAKKHDAEKQQAEQRRREELKKRKGCIAIAVAAVIVLILLIRASVYSSSNVKITLTPADNYLTARYNSYVFTYDAEIKNKGFLDIRQLQGTVLFEDGRTVVVDTSIGFYNSSSSVVRGKKTSHYTWELTVQSEDIAQILYEDFDDLKIKIDIDEIVYTNGKRKTY